MNTILDALKELVNYELAVVMGLDESASLRVRAVAGPLANSRLGNFTLSLAERPDIALLLEAGTPHLFAEGEEHVDTYDAVLDMPDEHSCLLSPLRIGDETIGMLTLDHRVCGVYSPEILAFIAVISRLIAVALVQNETERRLRYVNTQLVEERNRLLERETDAFRNFAGESPAWREVIELVKLVASAESPVLLLGETGTGKEEAARAIHRLSPRADGPFIALNCSALPENLAESELFGHEKGSFTGAQGLRKGRFELASGGTLFLDEIGELPPEIQPKLLRALQEGRFERVGGEKPVTADVRIIAATHVDLGDAVERRTFREDLFYRISVFPIRLPPLRERGNDAILLAELFAAKLRSRSGWEGLTYSSDALDTLLERPWAGNVRELKNAVERAAILARGGIITAEHLTAGDWARMPGGNQTRGFRGADSPTIGRAAVDGSNHSALLAPAAGPAAPGERKIGGKLGVHPSELGVHPGELGVHPSGPGVIPGGPGVIPGGPGVIPGGPGVIPGGPGVIPGGLKASVAELERSRIRDALEKSGGKIYGSDGAAALLGLKPTTLQSRMKKLGIPARREG